MQMFFIGIISGKDYDKIENELYKKLNKNEYTIVNITNESIEDIRNIKFDIILITNPDYLSSQNNECLKKIINNSKYLVINTDIKYDLKILEQIKINVITYGFNSKNTITASSINEDSIQICIQRNIKNINSKLVEQQDKKVEIKGRINTNYIMGIIAILIVFEKI